MIHLNSLVIPADSCLVTVASCCHLTVYCDSAGVTAVRLAAVMTIYSAPHTTKATIENTPARLVLALLIFEQTPGSDRDGDSCMVG